MKPETGQDVVRPGAVVQIAPDHGKDGEGNKAFAACMLTVTEVKTWGVQGYVQGLGTRAESGGQAYYRVKWDQIEPVGMSHWCVP